MSEVIGQPRDFPAVEQLMQQAKLSEAIALLPRAIAVQIVQEQVSRQKRALADSGQAITMAALVAGIDRALREFKRLEMTPVINAAGIVVHTNLGRAPLSDELFEAARRIVRGYSNIEFDLNKGVRGKRGVACERYLATIAGAEAATVVNNCAAALFLMLNTFANRRQVVISRGELVQIGGGFRIPDILRRSGAKLCEVGATNITTLEDYEAAVDDRTALILKVHKSNFVQAGFTEEVALRELVPLARQHGKLIINDLGSGVLIPTREAVGYDEPTVQQSVKAGADLTSFSGDKLLGGVQAGLIVGRAELVAKVKKNPLFRTVRVDKMVFAMLERLLSSYLDGTHLQEIRLWRMLSVAESELYKTARKMLKDLGSPSGLSVESTGAYVGGGSLPEASIPSVGIVFSAPYKASRLMRVFRQMEPPIIGRIEQEHFVLDLKTVAPDELPVVQQAIALVVKAEW
jgi:L-seryl-tRNA(Ser) seleniumtransferase